MKIWTLTAALAATAAVTGLCQEGVLQDVKHGAKKTGETIKDGLETAGEKTKETAKTVGQKTKETAQTIGEKTKETGERVATKTKETVEDAGDKTIHAGKKSHRSSTKASANQESRPESSPTSR
jgi:hypothetical protein